MMVINKLNGAAGEQVQIRVEVTDLNGVPVDTLSQGEDFQLRAYTKDLRLPADDPNRGVFSVYFDVNYDTTRVGVDLDPRTITYGLEFPNQHRPDTQFTNTAGLFDDVGAVGNGNPYGTREELVFVVPMTATSSGEAFFSLDPEDSELLEVLVYFEVVPDNEILFIGDSVTIGTQPSASIADLSLPEGNVQSIAQLTVTLSSPAIVPTTIAYTTMVDTGPNPATAGTDYATTTDVITFLVGETTQTIDIPILGDLSQEPDETFKVVLSAPVGATITDSEAIVTIENDDAPPVITISNVNVVEPTAGTTNAVFVVSLSKAVDQPVTVDYTTVNGTAVAPGDYTTTTNTLTIPAGQVSGTISVPVRADADTEGVENFTLMLSNPDGGTFPGGAANISGTATIVDPTAAKVILRLESRNPQGELQSVFQPGDEIRILAYLTDATGGDPDTEDGVFQAFHDMVYDTSMVDVISRPITFGPAYPNQQSGDLTTDGLVDEIGASGGAYGDWARRSAVLGDRLYRPGRRPGPLHHGRDRVSESKRNDPL